MQIHDLRAPRGSRKRRKIVGRGKGSGHGKTSGKGHKGQKARSGRGILNSLEGGQIPLIRRLPKIGFRSKRPTLYQVVKLEKLAQFKDGSIVDGNALKEKRIIKSLFRPYKVLGNGEIKKALTVKAYSFSKSAAEKIEKAGGRVETVDRSTFKSAEATNKE